MTFQVRLAQENDEERLAEIGATTFTSTFGHLYSEKDLCAFIAKSHRPEVYRKLLGDSDHRAWIAESAEGETVGYAVAGPCGLPVPDMPPDSGELQRIYLTEGAKGAGVGARLMTAALEFLRARYGRVYLSVHSENFTAQRFYERFGFVKLCDYFYMVGDHADPEWIMELKEARIA